MFLHRVLLLERPLGFSGTGRFGEGISCRVLYGGAHEEEVSGYLGSGTDRGGSREGAPQGLLATALSWRERM